MNSFYNPVEIFEGIDCVRALRRVIHTQVGENPRILLLGYSDAVLGGKTYQRIWDQLVGMKVYGAVCPLSNPDLRDVFKVYEETRQRDIDLIIAVGGGGLLDMAKVLGCLYSHRIPNEDALRSALLSKRLAPGCPWIGVPTTQGSGSEVTSCAVVWDRAKAMVHQLEHPANFALAAFVDPSLAMGMPVALGVSSALDALCHAVESFWSNGATSISTHIALKAAATLRGGLATLPGNPYHQSVMEAMAHGSLLAGMAISSAGATACHALAYPLTLQRQIPHGIAAGMVLGQVARHNWFTVKDIDQMAAQLRIKTADGLENLVQALLEKADIPGRLRDWNVEETELTDLAKAALNSACLANNPTKLGEKEIHAIFKKIY